MPRIQVLTDNGQLVDARHYDSEASDSAIGREVTGRNEPIRGWLGRALEDAVKIQKGVDPERPSEKAMRMVAEKQAGHDFDGGSGSGHGDTDG